MSSVVGSSDVCLWVVSYTYCGFRSLQISELYFIEVVVIVVLVVLVFSIKLWDGTPPLPTK